MRPGLCNHVTLLCVAVPLLGAHIALERRADDRVEVDLSTRDGDIPFVGVPVAQVRGDISIVGGTVTGVGSRVSIVGRRVPLGRNVRSWIRADVSGHGSSSARDGEDQTA